MYDWANSVYPLVITTAIFPVYFSSTLNPDKLDGFLIQFLGFDIQPSSLYSYSVSFTYLLAIVFTVLCSGIADVYGKKKMFMRIFCYMGAFSCASMYWFDSSEMILLGISAFVLAGVGYSSSMVFYNGFLPEIAEAKDQDKLSAKGFALGYIGSVILLISNILILENWESLGFTGKGHGTRFGFLLVGAWWFFWSFIPFSKLPQGKAKQKVKRPIIQGLKELKVAFNWIKQRAIVKGFILSFFLYACGYQAVLYMATIFGTEVIKIETSILIGLMLVIQLVGVLGAYLFAFISKKKGNFSALLICVSIWFAIGVYTYFITNLATYAIAAVLVGLTMGGIQSLSRSTYSKLIEGEEETASLFFFFDVFEKLSIVVGTAVYGMLTQATGNLRMGIFGIIGFFLFGVIAIYSAQRLNNKLERKNFAE